MKGVKEENEEAVSQTDCEMKTIAARILAKGKQKAKPPPQPRRPGRPKKPTKSRLRSEIFYRGGSSLTGAGRGGISRCARSLSVPSMVTSADADDNARQGDDSPQPGPSGILPAADHNLDDHSDSTTSSDTPQHSFLSDPMDDNAMDGVDYDISNNSIDTGIMNSKSFNSGDYDAYLDGTARSEALASADHDFQGEASGGQEQAIDYTDNQMLLFNEDPALDDYSYGKEILPHEHRPRPHSTVVSREHRALISMGGNKRQQENSKKQKENQISCQVGNCNKEMSSFIMSNFQEGSGQPGDNCRQPLSSSPLETTQALMTGADAASHSSDIAPQPMPSEQRHFRELSEVPPDPTAQNSAQVQPPQDIAPQPMSSEQRHFRELSEVPPDPTAQNSAQAQPPQDIAPQPMPSEQRHFQELSEVPPDPTAQNSAQAQPPQDIAPQPMSSEQRHFRELSEVPPDPTAQNSAQAQPPQDIAPQPMPSEQRHFQELSEVPPDPTAQNSAQAQPPQDIVPQPMPSEQRHFRELSEVAPDPTAQNSAQAQPSQEEMPSTCESAEVEANGCARPRRPYRQLYVPPARRASVSDPARSAYVQDPVEDPRQRGLPPYRKPWPRREPPAPTPAPAPHLQAEYELFEGALMPSPQLQPRNCNQMSRATTPVSPVDTESVQSVQLVEPVDLSSPRTFGPHSVHAEPFYPSHVIEPPPSEEEVRLQFAIVESCHNESPVEGGLQYLEPVSFTYEPIRPDYSEGEPTYQQPLPVYPQRPTYQQPLPVYPQRPTYQQPLPVYPQRPTYQQPLPVYSQRPTYQQPLPAYPQRPIYQQPLPLPAYRLPMPAYYEPQQLADPLYAIANVQMGSYAVRSDGRRFPTAPPPAYAHIDLNARVRYHASRESDRREYGAQFLPPSGPPQNAFWDASYQRDVREAANAPAVPEAPAVPAVPAVPVVPDSPDSTQPRNQQRPYDAASFDNLGAQRIGLGRGRLSQFQRDYLQQQRPGRVQAGPGQAQAGPGQAQAGLGQAQAGLGQAQAGLGQAQEGDDGDGALAGDEALVRALKHAIQALTTKTHTLGRGRGHVRLPDTP